MKIKVRCLYMLGLYNFVNDQSASHKTLEIKDSQKNCLRFPNTSSLCRQCASFSSRLWSLYKEMKRKQTKPIQKAQLYFSWTNLFFSCFGRSFSEPRRYSSWSEEQRFTIVCLLVSDISMRFELDIYSKS